jgi:hypothetical protein
MTTSFGLDFDCLHWHFLFDLTVSSTFFFFSLTLFSILFSSLLFLLFCFLLYSFFSYFIFFSSSSLSYIRLYTFKCFSYLVALFLLLDPLLFFIYICLCLFTYSMLHFFSVSSLFFLSILPFCSSLLFFPSVLPFCSSLLFFPSVLPFCSSFVSSFLRSLYVTSLYLSQLISRELQCFFSTSHTTFSAPCTPHTTSSVNLHPLHHVYPACLYYG